MCSNYINKNDKQLCDLICVLYTVKKYFGPMQYALYLLHK